MKSKQLITFQTNDVCTECELALFLVSSKGAGRTRKHCPCKGGIDSSKMKYLNRLPPVDVRVVAHAHPPLRHVCEGNWGAR